MKILLICSEDNGKENNENLFGFLLRCSLAVICNNSVCGQNTIYKRPLNNCDISEKIKFFNNPELYNRMSYGNSELISDPDTRIMLWLVPDEVLVNDIRDLAMDVSKNKIFIATARCNDNFAKQIEETHLAF